MGKQKPRIAANINCLNCGAHLSSQFCPQCGQKNKDYRLSFKDLFSDFLEEMLDMDSRVLRTMRTLFTKPGFLTTEYIKGRRISYLPPVRIYLVASVVFFLLLSLKAMLPSVQNNQFIRELTSKGGVEESLSSRIKSQQASKTDQTALFEEQGLVSAESDSSHSGMSLSFDDQAFDVEQGEFLNSFTDNFAKMMFLLLPVAALQLKLLYWRRRKLYIEHLIFSLHVHAFIFSLLILTVILDYKPVMWTVILASLIYLYLSMKNYYEQSYMKTFSKMFLLLFSYGLTTGLVMVLTLVITAIAMLAGS
ncbi:MAG: DUF3667 domain-containing protein [Candidatus Marinimicrobia bacterium]|nr:DUF3667 domain-containing protein [Candidatus Neomarinimicrobiota bacterium]